MEFSYPGYEWLSIACSAFWEGEPVSTARTLLVLGRVSNLPTVWTNCLCGWLLGGGGSEAVLLLLCLGATLLYVGGMYLNDAFDAAFDRQFRRERPIPRGAIREALVWQLGTGMMIAGAVPHLCLGWLPAVFTLLLVGSIVLYDAVHKAIAFSRVIMAACRFFLVLVAASAGQAGLTGLAVWSAVALAGGIVGLSYVARQESVKGPMALWPLAALALPIERLAATDLPTIIFSHVPFSGGSMVGNYWFQNKPDHATYPNSGDIRTIVEASDRVILCVAGHVHWNSLHTVNAIPHITIQDLTESFTTDGEPAEAWATLEIGSGQIRWRTYGYDPIEIVLPVRQPGETWARCLPPMGQPEP